MTSSKRTLCVLSTLAFSVVGMMGASALAQSTSTATTASPVAYVYVSNQPTSTTQQINAFAAAANGSLTKIAGSPFPAHTYYPMATNGKWLYATDAQDIYSYAIESNGALKAGPSVNAASFNPGGGGGPINLFFDHTGQSLYDGDIYIDGANNGYQAWKVVETTGQLDFNGNVEPYNVEVGYPLKFIGNNEYGYSAACVKGGQDIYGYKRGSGGTLTNLNISPAIPSTNVSGWGYCPFLAAADPTNHVAISMTPTDDLAVEGPAQIAVYTADASGNLTTTSTSSTMPKLSIGLVTDMSMAPSGKLLAVGGRNGLQVLHFNGANPATLYTGRLTVNMVDQMFWDSNNHLYAVARGVGKLYVWTVTPTSVTAAPGSPHSIYHPLNVVVLSK